MLHTYAGSSSAWLFSYRNRGRVACSLIGRSHESFIVASADGEVNDSTSLVVSSPRPDVTDANRAIDVSLSGDAGGAWYRSEVPVRVYRAWDDQASHSGTSGPPSQPTEGRS